MVIYFKQKNGVEKRTEVFKHIFKLVWDCTAYCEIKVANEHFLIKFRQLDYLTSVVKVYRNNYYHPS